MKSNSDKMSLYQSQNVGMATVGLPVRLPAACLHTYSLARFRAHVRITRRVRVEFVRADPWPTADPAAEVPFYYYYY